MSAVSLRTKLANRLATHHTLTKALYAVNPATTQSLHTLASGNRHVCSPFCSLHGNSSKLARKQQQQRCMTIQTSEGQWQTPAQPKWQVAENAIDQAPWHSDPLKDAQTNPVYTKLHELSADRSIIMLGFGAIGTGVLPLLFRHIQMSTKQFKIISNTFTEVQRKMAQRYGVECIEADLKIDDYKPTLEKYVKSNDLLINVSVDVSSVALIEHCATVDALYIDTCNEPWAGGYSDPNLTASQRSNYGIREQALELRRQNKVQPDGPTAVLTHGANPGLVSHFVKQGLLNIAKDTGFTLQKTPESREQWAELMRDLGIKTLHIAEKDTQASNQPKKLNEFTNTWSIEGFQEEGKQPVEMGWGTHEPEFPHDGARHGYGSDAGIYLNRPGALTPVRTWTPMNGNFHGLNITHTEAVTIADYFTVKSKDGKVDYRPTCHFAYHASNDAMASMSEVAGKEWQRLDSERVVTDSIVHGADELGILFLGHKKTAYWFGSNLSIFNARALTPNNNATSLQVCAGVLSGAVWALENPRRGLVEPEEMDHKPVLDVAMLYLGKMVGQYSDWTPLYRRGLLFDEDLDKQNVWAFKNFRV